MNFIIASPLRTSLRMHAAVLAKYNHLRKYLTGARSLPKGIPSGLAERNLFWGGAVTAVAMATSSYVGEWVRSFLHPVFDRWVKTKIRKGDHIISSYGYANESFKLVQNNGGRTFLLAGNSHPAYFWKVICEEHSLWGDKAPPYPPHWNAQGLRMLEHTDYVICPSQYVQRTYLDAGWAMGKLLYIPYPVDLTVFQHSSPPPPDPIRVICTGSVGYRKGIPYLLEAIRLLRKSHNVVLMLMGSPKGPLEKIFSAYSDIPIEWAPQMPHPQLAARLATAHVFALLSLEDGFALTVAEALAVGLPAVVTPNTGSMDLIQNGVNGFVVPIRDPESAAEAIWKSCELRMRGIQSEELHRKLSFDQFEQTMKQEFFKIGLPIS